MGYAVYQILTVLRILPKISDTIGFIKEKRAEGWRFIPIVSDEKPFDKVSTGSPEERWDFATRRLRASLRDGTYTISCLFQVIFNQM